MPDRMTYQLRVAVASNTGGPFVTAWDRTVVTSPGTIRAVYAVAQSLTSNGRQNTVDVYRQADAPSVGSNTAETVLVDPITLANNNDAAGGSIRAGNPRVAAGDQLQLRTYADTVGHTPAFTNLTATVEVERDEAGNG